VVAEALEVVAADRHGLLEATADGFRILEAGRPFVRTIASRFDRYLAAQPAARHALGV
jgi:oxygen-independent coproporphyrinogen-3 oxidase